MSAAAMTLIPASTISAASDQPSVSWARRKASPNSPVAVRSAGGPRSRFTRTLEPDVALAHPALAPPEEVEARPRGQHRVGIDRKQTVEREAVLSSTPPELLEMGTFRAGVHGFGLAEPDLQVEAGVAIADQVQFTGQGELFRGVLTDRLQQLVQAGLGVSQE